MFCRPVFRAAACLALGGTGLTPAFAQPAFDAEAVGLRITRTGPDQFDAAPLVRVAAEEAHQVPVTYTILVNGALAGENHMHTWELFMRCLPPIAPCLGMCQYILHSMGSETFVNGTCVPLPIGLVMPCVCVTPPAAQWPVALVGLRPGDQITLILDPDHLVREFDETNNRFHTTFQEPRCVADVDDGSGTGTPDGGVTIEDLLYYLTLFESGDLRADVDDGSGNGTPDGGVTIEDLLYYLLRFESGC